MRRLLIDGVPKDSISDLDVFFEETRDVKRPADYNGESWRSLEVKYPSTRYR